MSGFTYTLSEHFTEDSPGYAKTIKSLEYLGPWCSNCGRRGKNCRDRTKCNLRKIRSMNTAKYVSLRKGDPAFAYEAEVKAFR